MYIQDGKAWTGFWLGVMINDGGLRTCWAHVPSGYTKSCILLGGNRNGRCVRDNSVLWIRVEYGTFLGRSRHSIHLPARRIGQ
jgi:hypothetical protein